MTEKDLSCSGFDPNWLALFIVLYSIPILVLVGLSAGIAMPVPAGSLVGVEVLAFCAVLSGARNRAFRPGSPLHRMTLAWPAISIAVIMAAAAEDHGLANFFVDMWITVIPVILISIVVGRLLRFSENYARLPPFLAGTAALFLGALWIHGMLRITIGKLPILYDPVLYRIDALLGIDWNQPAAAIYSFNGVLTSYFLQVYIYLNAAIILAAASEVFHARSLLDASLILRSLIAACVGYGVFFLVPAVAPLEFFGADFPAHLPAAASVATQFVLAPPWAETNFPRNAFPSLHAAWSILAFLALRRSPLWHRVLGGLLVAATFITTLGTGWHYTLDWIGALSLVLLARGICAFAAPASMRRWAVLAGASIVGCWVALLRGAPASLDYPKLIEGFAVLSVAVPVWLEARLARAEERAAKADYVTGGASVSGAKTGIFAVRSL
jgi:hypothetical protein